MPVCSGNYKELQVVLPWRGECTALYYRCRQQYATVGEIARHLNPPGVNIYNNHNSYPGGKDSAEFLEGVRVWILPNFWQAVLHYGAG